MYKSINIERTNLVTGMDCNHCKSIIEKNLRKIKDVESGTGGTDWSEGGGLCPGAK